MNKNSALNIIILLFICFLFIELVPAQKTILPVSKINKTDSLLNQLKIIRSDTDEISLLLEIGDIYKNNMPDTALYYYNKALSGATKAANYKYVALCINYIGTFYFGHSIYNKAIECYLKSLKIFEEVGDKKGMAQCCNNIGNIHYSQGAYEKATEYYLRALKISEELHNKKGMSICYTNIGNVYIEQCSYEKANEYYLKSLKINEESGNKKGIALCYNNIGNVYYNQITSNSNKVFAADNFSKANKYYMRALKIFEEIGDKSGMSLCYNNAGLVYHNQGASATNKELATAKYNEAIVYYSKSLKIREELGDKSGMSYVFENIAILYIKLNKYNEAVEYALKGLKIAKETGGLPLKNTAYENLATAYEKLRDYKKAYEYQMLFKQINDSIFNKERSKQVADLQIKYETEKKEKDIRVKEKEIEVLEVKRYILYAILTMVIITALLIALWLRYRINANKKISKTEKELIQTRLKDSENEKKVLNLQLEYKNKEIENFALHIVEKNEFLAKLKTMLINSDEHINTPDLIQTIDMNLLSLEKERKEFEAYIEQVSHTFFIKLRELIPDITKNEERLATLLRLNLSSKEIAAVLNITSPSVDTYRYKLRKKLNLSEDVSLYEFLNNL